jgi:hypothetical protein
VSRPVVITQGGEPKGVLMDFARRVFKSLRARLAQAGDGECEALLAGAGAANQLGSGEGSTASLTVSSCRMPSSP